MKIFILILAVLFVFAGCNSTQESEETKMTTQDAAATTAINTEAPTEEPTEEPDAVSLATEDRYQENEIREYQGMRLDPAIGPRDNSIKGVQEVDIDSYRLSVTGLVETQLYLTYDEVLEFPAFEKLITLHCVEGWDATILWKGVLLSDIMDEAGYDDTAKIVIFKSVDGYTTSMPIETVLEREMIMAYEANAAVLPPSMGYPFIIVAEDKLGYKWARWVTEIELSDDIYYEGYWEKLGFSNEAELP